MALNELEMLDDIVVAMKPEQLVICLGYIRDWNTTARNSHQAQVMLLSILRVFPMETLVKCKGIREVADAMIPYTERHFQRLEDALQRTYALDFTLHAMNKVLGGDDGFEDEGQTLGWSIDTKGKHRRGEDALEEAAAPAPRPDDEADGESDDGDDEDEEGGAAGWGSWGGAAGDAADDGEDEDEEEDQEEEVEEAASRPARAEKTPQGKKNAREPAATTGKRKSKGAGGEEAGGDGETGGGGAVVKKRKSLPGTERAAPTTPARKRLDVDDAPPSGVKSGKKSRPGAGEETPGKGARSPVATRSVKTPGKSGGSSVKKSKTRE
ncbi:Utp13 specific WD40 associated domain-containing protein [Baffinella frigidus]|nr:Utp13 specific WD40 associated domain-containing protein [Cryptophyta sp. CCMP2293]